MPKRIAGALYTLCPRRREDRRSKSGNARKTVRGRLAQLVEHLVYTEPLGAKTPEFLRYVVELYVNEARTSHIPLYTFCTRNRRGNVSLN